MPKMRGLLHSRPKIDEEEAALAQSRVSARLATLFGAGASAPGEAPPAEDSSADSVEEPDRGDAAAMPSWVPTEPGPWLGLARPPIVVEGEDQRVGAHADGDEVELVAVMARTEDEVGDDGWAPLLAGPTERAPGPGQGDATTVDEGDVAKSAEPDAPAPVEPVPARVEPPRAAAAGPSRQGSREDRPGRSLVGRSPASRPRARKVRAATVPVANCPYCALLMQLPPASSRRCDRCRQRIVVRRAEGRAVYLTEAAVLVFEAERQRVAASGRLTRERDRWLRLAAAAAAPAQRQSRLAAAPLSEGVVDAARALYMGTVDRAFRAAKREKDWESASRIRREQATALHRMVGSPLPPSADIVALFREGVAAELRGIAEISRDAELVSASCCDVCMAEHRQIFRIALELREPRLPHAGCPKGLCRCGWDLAARDRSAMRRLLRRRPRPESQAVANEPPPEA
jgi:hypothetical protein